MPPPDDYSYLGTLDPNVHGSHFNSLSFIAEQVRNQISTATPVKIVTAPYDATGNPIPPGSAVAIGYVDVLPLVNQIDGYGNATPHGTVYHLSYHRYQGGNGAFISDPVVGDIGKMVVAERDTSAVKATNAQANPGSRRAYDKADGTYFGCTQSAGAPTQYFSWTATGFKIADTNGNLIIGGPTGVTINGVLITLAGDVVSKSGVDLDTHVHTGVTTGASNTGMPVP